MAASGLALRLTNPGSVTVYCVRSIENINEPLKIVLKIENMASGVRLGTFSEVNIYAE